MVLAATYPSWLDEVIAAPPETLGSVMLEADPHSRRLDRAARVAAVDAALADGASTARALRKRFRELGPEEIARELAVPVEATEDDPCIGSLWRFAEYRERPARILLYRRGLEPLDGVVTGCLAKRLVGQATLPAVFVAHELFHHAEATRPDTPIARRYQATLFRIGSWQWRTGIAALSEIAAGAFAQTLLDLPCHPKVLDLIALDALSSCAAAARVAARITSGDALAARTYSAKPHRLAVSKIQSR